MVVRLDAISGTPICCALSKARPAPAGKAGCRTPVAVARITSFGTITIHPANGDGVVSRRIGFGGTAYYPVRLGTRPSTGCSCGNTAALMSKLGKKGDCTNKH